MNAFKPKSRTALLAGAALFVMTPGLVQADPKLWWLNVEGGVEYSDNVALEQSDANSMEGDVAAFLELDAGYKLVDEKDARVEIGYNFYQSVYDDLTAFNWQSHNPSAVAWMRSGGIKFGVEYSYTNSLLDDSFFLEQHMLSPTISTFITEDFFISGYYRFYSKNYNRLDDARDADTQQVGADVNYYFDRANKGYVSVGGGFTSEDTDGDAFDYDGFVGRAAAQHPVELFGKKGWAGSRPTSVALPERASTLCATNSRPCWPSDRRPSSRRRSMRSSPLAASTSPNRAAASSRVACIR